MADQTVASLSNTVNVLFTSKIIFSSLGPPDVLTHCQSEQFVHLPVSFRASG